MPLSSAELPAAIADDEVIVRAILTPWHWKGGKLKKQAFKPPAGSSKYSAMRLLMGSDYCKEKAVEIGQLNNKNDYCGLSSIHATSIKSVGGDVTDSRDEPNFLGHVDVDIGLVVPHPDDPPDTPEAQLQLDDRLDALLRSAAFHADPAPAGQGWTGEAISPPAAPANTNQANRGIGAE